MNNRQLFTLLLGFSILFGAFLLNPTISSAKSVNKYQPEKINQTESLMTTGTIPGTNISYIYGLDTFDASDSFQVTNNGTAHDSYKDQRVQNVTMDLVNLSSIVVQKYVYRIMETKYINGVNSSRTFIADNTSYQQYIDTINASLGIGGEFIVTDFNATYGITDTAIVTTTNDNLGSFPTNTSFAEAQYNGVFNLTLTHVQEVIAVVVSHTPIKNVQVQYNYTLSVEAYFGYYNAYNISYNIHAEQWSAQINDGDRMGLYVSAFKNLQLNYTEIKYSVLSYFIASSVQVNLTYANGTYVPFENYPFALRPAYFQQNGTIQDIGINQVNTTALVASTTAVQAFQARVSKDVGPNAHVDAAAFTAWMVSSTPRLLSYKDANLNHQLDLEYNPLDGLKQSSGDFINYVGVLEASQGDAVSYHQYNQTYDQQLYTLQGFQEINDTQKGVNSFDESYVAFHKGFGTNASVTPTFNPYWNDPVNNSGTFTFNFGIKYVNFPVDWVSMTDGSETLVPMNVTYDYTYDLNPYTGSAKLSPTITYGAIVDTTLKSNLDGSSLATMYQSDFLSVTALRASKRESADTNVTSSRAVAFAAVSFAGPQNNFTTIDTRHGKENYTLDGAPYTTEASILNLASFSGSAGAANVTVFQSDNADIMNSAMIKQTTVETLNLNYRKDLLLISYPEWSGGEIVHDPSFSAVYQPNQASPTFSAVTANTNVDVGSNVELQWVTNDPDNNGATFKVTDASNNVVKSGNWNSGQSIVYTFIVVEGANVYTCTITDHDGNSATSTITITGVNPTSSATSTTGSNTVTTTPPLSTSISQKQTSSAPGFTLEIFFVLSLVSLTLFSRKKRGSN